MIVDVWDLMGSESFVRWDSSIEDPERKTRLARLGRILVNPDTKRFANRLPYLLDPDRPSIDCLLTPDGNIIPDICARTWLLRELLLPPDKSESPAWQDPPDRNLFRAWFHYQRGVLEELLNDGEQQRFPAKTDSRHDHTLFSAKLFLLQKPPFFPRSYHHRKP